MATQNADDDFIFYLKVSDIFISAAVIFPNKEPILIEAHLCILFKSFGEIIFYTLGNTNCPYFISFAHQNALVGYAAKEHLKTRPKCVIYG